MLVITINQTYWPQDLTVYSYQIFLLIEQTDSAAIYLFIFIILSYILSRSLCPLRSASGGTYRDCAPITTITVISEAEIERALGALIFELPKC